MLCTFSFDWCHNLCLPQLVFDLTDKWGDEIDALTSSKKLVARRTRLNCFPPPILNLLNFEKYINWHYDQLDDGLTDPQAATPLSDWENHWSWWCVCKTAQKLWDIWVCFCSWSPRNISQTSQSSPHPIQTYPAGTRQCSPSRWRHLWLLNGTRESKCLENMRPKGNE